MLRTPRLTGKAALTALILGLSAPILAACEDDGPAEQMGEAIDENAEQMGDAMEENAEEMGDAMEQQADRVEERLDQTQ